MDHEFAGARFPWRHSHVFDAGNAAGEKNTIRVVILTSTMMVVEIVAGWWFNSMALLADGWHMSSHAAALGVSVIAYRLARRFSNDPRFAFGAWKIEVLGGYSSALLLAVVALLMFIESVVRLFNPRSVQFAQAIGVAVIGLGVNLVSAWLLQRTGHHHHDDHGGDGHRHEHDHHHDINLRAAYLHVVADAATSVLAIVALLGGLFLGLMWLDPMMGIVGSVLIANWARALLRDSGRVLLDAEMDAPVVARIREKISQALPEAELCDLHIWRVGKKQYACIIGLAAATRLTPDDVRRELAGISELAHVSVEVNHFAELIG